MRTLRGLKEKVAEGWKGGKFHLSQPPFPPMLGQILLRRPEVAIRRWDDTPAGKGQEKTGGVGNEADLARGDNVVIVANPHHPFIEGPVAELAQRHAVVLGLFWVAAVG